MRFLSPPQILICLSLLFVFACAKKAPEPEKATNPEWGKVIINPTAEVNHKNLELWKSKAIKHYRYKAKITCDSCGLVTYYKNLIEVSPKAARGAGWTIIEVSNDKLTSVKNFDGTPNLDFEERLNVYHSDVIKIAFDWIDDSIQYVNNTQLVIYDSNFGFPRFVELLASEKGPTDVGHRIEIVEFEVLPELPEKPANELK